MKKLTLLCAPVIAIVMTSFAAAAGAQSVRSEKNISLELANQIAAASVAACTANRYALAATVVDRAGTVRAACRQCRPAYIGRQLAKGLHVCRGRK